MSPGTYTVRGWTGRDIVRKITPFQRFALAHLAQRGEQTTWQLIDAYCLATLSAPPRLATSHRRSLNLLLVPRLLKSNTFTDSYSPVGLP